MAARRAAPARQRRSAPPSPEELELAVAILRERLQAEGALKVSSIAPKSARAELCARLVAEGYELGGTWLRRPVREQLREALGHGAALARPGLAAAVRGASAAELARVVSELERGGELYRVLRGKSETIVGASAPVLPPAALEPLVAPLSRALAAANKKKGMMLLASDVEAWLAELRGAVERARGERTAAPRAGGAPPATGALLDALDATRDAQTGLSFVPRVVERLAPSVSVAVAHELLLQAARDERIELRPEGGLGRLTSDELGLCPAGPGGTRLSWARRLDGAA